MSLLKFASIKANDGTNRHCCCLLLPFFFSCSLAFALFTTSLSLSSVSKKISTNQSKKLLVKLMTYVAFGNNEATNICFFLYLWLTHFYLCLLISTTQRLKSNLKTALARYSNYQLVYQKKKNPNDFDASSKRLWYRLLCAFFVQIVYICSSEKTFVSPTTHTHICMNVPSKQTETHFKLTSPAIQKYTTCLRRISSSCAGIN